jgi:hypothetical protein
VDIAEGLVEQLAYDDTKAPEIPDYLARRGVEPDVVEKVRRALYFGNFVRQSKQKNK